VTFALAFVDSIAEAPAIRLNLNDGTNIRTLANGTVFGMPILERATSSSKLADGEAVPAAAYGNRMLTLHLDLDGLTDDAIATQLQLVAREINRPSNVLRYKPGTSQAVHFRTLRSDFNDLTWDGDVKRATALVLAEPFAYGTKQALSLVTVNNDPAAVSNGMFFDVSAPLGDVETPLFMSVAQAGVTVSGRRTSAIAVRRRGTPSALPFVVQAEAMTMGTDTTVQANDAVMSGAGSNYVRCTFATSTMATRVSTTHPSSASEDARGTYRVYVRYRKSVSGDSITMRLTANLDGVTVSGDTYTLPSGTNRKWQDLGLVQYPMGPDPVVDGYSGTALSVRGVELRIEAARPAGSGNLDIDAVILVPADDRFALIKWSEFSGPTAFIVDPAKPQVYAVGASGEVRTTQFAELTGLLPYISPGVTNRVYFVLDVGTTNVTDTKTNTVDITPYYWPRYLGVARPVST